MADGWTSSGVTLLPPGHNMGDIPWHEEGPWNVALANDTLKSTYNVQEKKNLWGFGLS